MAGLMPDEQRIQPLAVMRTGLAGLWNGYGWSLTTHLTVLAIAIMVPLLFLAGLSLRNHIEARRLALYQDAQHMADNLSANMEREMASVLTLLNVLAQDTAFDRKEFNTLYTRAKEGLKGRKGYVVLFGLDTRPLFSTRFPFGMPLPEPVDDGSAEQVMKTKHPLVSNLYFSRAAQRRVFSAIVPILRDDKVVGRLQLALEPQDLTEAVMPVGASPSWQYSLADRRFTYVTSSDPGAYEAGQPVQRSIVGLIKDDAGQFRAEIDAGRPLLTAYRTSPLIGWTAFVTAPLASVEQPLSEVWHKFTYIALAAFALSLIAAYAFSLAMARPIHRLTGAALAFGEGNEVPTLHSSLLEANVLSSALSEAAAQLKGRTRALTESDRRFRLFAEQSNDVIWFADPEKGSIDYVSPAFEAISGRRCGDLVSIASWREAVHPEDQAEFDKQFGGVLHSNAQYEYRLLRPDGAKRWVRDARFPLDLTAGRPRIVAGILRDITGRKEAIDALTSAQAEAQARLEELETLYSSAPIGLALMDRDCRLLRLNAFLATLGGKSLEEANGKLFFAVFPELESVAKSHCEEVIKTGIPARNIELEVYERELGTSQYMLANFYPIQVKGGVTGVGAILENISERKRTEQVLARLAAVVYAANDAMFSIAPTGRIQNWNPAAQQLFQYAEAEAIDRNFSMLFPEGKDDDYQELLRVWEAGESLRLNTEFRRKDGTLFQGSVSIAPIKDRERVIAISTTIEDITERRRSEKRQLLMNRELSHRVKNTLAVIQAMARHTLRSSPDPAAFTAAFEGRLRALSIAHNLLTSSEWEGAELSELAREQLAPHLSGAGRLRLDGAPLLISPGMATSLGLVLHELGSNAAKFGALSVPNGSVTLKWRVSPSTPHKTLTIEWIENGGPAVHPPKRKGFGSVLIENSGKVEQHFEAGGLRSVIHMALMEQVPQRSF
jgi:PAS domain S-box-containing protein